jgi:large subunit ribosomal protein L24
MASLTPIRKNDQVYVLRGRDRGKTGRVLIVMPGENRVVVEGVQLIKRHTRPNPQKNIKGGIVEKEAPIDVSNVAVVCKTCNKRTRIGIAVLDASVKPRRVERTCRKCGNSLD